MKPVATALDRMQSDRLGYMGNFLSEIYRMKLCLENFKNSKPAPKYAGVLVDALLAACDKR